MGDIEARISRLELRPEDLVQVKLSLELEVTSKTGPMTYYDFSLMMKVILDIPSILARLKTESSLTSEE